MMNKPLSIESYIPVQQQSIDWAHLIKRRKMILGHIPGIKPYLLLPEVHAILHNVNDPDLHFFINTLWRFGPRITEALELTKKSFLFDDPEISYVSIKTLKKPQADKAKMKIPAARLVPSYDHGYKSELISYCVSKGLGANDPIFPKVRNTYNKQLERLEARLKSDKGLEFPVKLHPHLFRHSFAVNCLINRILLTDIQRYLGHKNLSETEVYTHIFTGETDTHMAQVKF